VLKTDSELMARLGFTLPEFEQDLTGLHTSREQASRTITSLGAPPRTVERTLRAVRATGAGISGWLLILRDVTEEQELTRLRDDLTHMLIHDLRSPLGSILTSLALIQQVAKPGQPLDPDLFELLGLAESSGQQLLRLINQLLEIARLESGAIPLNRQPTQPAELVESALERQRAAAEAAKVNLSCEVAPDLRPIAVDPELVGRVLDNLLDNAVKYTPDGAGVRLWVRPSTIRGLVVFGVRDEGPGIAQEEQDRLFQKFQRIRGQRARRGGTGLGLAFCKLVVEAHQGKIWLESAPGAGSTFAFSLPVEGPKNDDP
jgi:signal transduction histidine kinase